MSDKHLIDVQEVAPAEVSEIDLYQRREKIYTRKIEGFFQRIRLYTGWPLLIGYFLLPWLSWDGRQAVWFDLPERKFHILGLVFWPQDFPLLAFLLIIAAFGLFAVTVFAGRVWCGYTCPQTVWTSIFMWIEQRFEGSRNQRMRLDKAPWSMEKLGRKVLKHGGWLFIAFLTGMTFVGYFYPIRELLPDLLTLSAGQWGVLWTIFFTCATYINAGWMREQVCKYMCPYARFQSVMFDQDTLIVSYDPVRGEPRGSRKRDADHRAQGLGDCIDCNLCVQVCPTGIDIRDGLQYECIGCALCIDACNSVMDKMSYPRGLISYTSEHQLQGGKTHWLRPRMIGYVLVLSMMVGLFSYRVISRVPLEMTVIRDRNELYVTTMDGDIENIYTLSLVNMEQSMHEFEIVISGIDGAEIIGDTLHTLDGGEVRSISLRVRIAPELLQRPSTEIEFTARATDRESLQISSESRFMRPL
ncbi:MAG TPA: cytochrome c oxidase accessory protein CcoG [Halieaceae bacterium]|jgi:cytochrome c oxidase accessory protein FixG|uniref:cytochrome c oxidase accessory protein CcoG n=1 Tax=Haliea TaxID=475794 RepID=UPI000C53F496|nr:cytochrome c oxidase accessory protein CcoG [Haliea sp.]HBM83546.1 cytochrome c oxidase accessory protein CcoG [Halieaceae bacterium]MAY93550.1 cytochrome c oxidase accessory protein CcoG [Haliea sp.]MBK41309.1 cytochrome c oxidase accessory protein CcoG [Haliea sp.]MBP71866.1 cytochrome c oxidase accessory protein CcoG [Haliea sp.]HBQ40288.1 cytochrome c oxidase accessory protein CcoG [Halieaceae bacterium]|tara:strand:- start:567 stop:1976 length:1410 start_codon:yes stop_codon:yes gene_type:complete